MNKQKKDIKANPAKISKFKKIISASLLFTVPITFAGSGVLIYSFIDKTHSNPFTLITNSLQYTDGKDKMQVILHSTNKNIPVSKLSLNSLDPSVSSLLQIIDIKNNDATNEKTFSITFKSTINPSSTFWEDTTFKIGAISPDNTDYFSNNILLHSHLNTVPSGGSYIISDTLADPIIIRFTKNAKISYYTQDNKQITIEDIINSGLAVKSTDTYFQVSYDHNATYHHTLKFEVRSDDNNTITSFPVSFYNSIPINFFDITNPTENSWVINGFSDEYDYEIAQKFDCMYFPFETGSFNLTSKAEVANNAFNYMDPLPNLTNVYFDSQGTAIGNMTIGAAAFSFDPYIKNVEFECPVTTLNLKTYCFQNCTSLENFNVVSLASAGRNCFEGCTSLTSFSVTVSTNIDIPDAFFKNCKSLSYLHWVPTSSSFSISAQAFMNCQSLTEFAGDIKNLGVSAFENCTKLTKITSPTFDTISESAFKNCSSLSDFNPSTIKVIKSQAFMNCSLLSHLEFSTTSIGSSAFENCISLSTIDITGLNIVVYSRAFYGCYSLGKSFIVDDHEEWAKVAIMPTNSLTLDNLCFAECTSITQIQLQNLISLGTQVFLNCDFTIRNNGVDPEDCPFYFPPGGEFKVVDMYTGINKSGQLVVPNAGMNSTTQIQLAMGDIYLNSSNVATGTTRLDNSNFAYCTGIKLVDFEENCITTIGSHAFIYCTNLETLDLSCITSTTDQYAFTGCNKIKNIFYLNPFNESIAPFDRWTFSHSGMFPYTLHIPTSRVADIPLWASYLSINSNRIKADS